MNGIEAALEGRIGQAPTMRTGQSGKTWCTFSVAVGSDEEGASPTWVSVAVFGSKAEEAAQLAPGVRVYGEGRLRLDTWQDREGRERTGLKIAASLVQPIAQIGRRKPAKPREAKATANAGSRSDAVYKPIGASLAGGSAERRYSGPDSEIPF